MGLKTESGLGVTDDSNKASIASGRNGVPVEVGVSVINGVSVIVGVREMVGVNVIDGVMVMVCVSVAVGEGGK
jgi:hypothetical protein